MRTAVLTPPQIRYWVTSGTAGGAGTTSVSTSVPIQFVINTEPPTPIWPLSLMPDKKIRPTSTRAATFLAEATVAGYLILILAHLVESIRTARANVDALIYHRGVTAAIVGNDPS